MQESYPFPCRTSAPNQPSPGGLLIISSLAIRYVNMSGFKEGIAFSRFLCQKRTSTPLSLKNEKNPCFILSHLLANLIQWMRYLSIIDDG